MIQFLRLGALTLCFVYAVAFILANGDRVTMVLPLAGTWEGLQLWIGVLLAAGMGAGVASVALSWPLLKLRKQSRRDAKRIVQLERELHGLRTLPLGEKPPAPLAAPPPAGE